MTNSKTLTDILAEMRGQSELWGRHAVCATSQTVSQWADCIEAAAQREKVEAVNLTDEKWRRDTGNAAAMREALDKIHLIATTNINECVGDESDIHIVNLAKAALAAPPRNCDVGTAEEQARRFEIFCQAHHVPWKIGMIKNECKCPCLQDNGRSCNYFVWAQMPYTSEGDAK